MLKLKLAMFTALAALMITVVAPASTFMPDANTFGKKVIPNPPPTCNTFPYCAE